MAVETEIKLRLPQGAQPAKVLLEQHDFRAISPRQLEINQIFDLPKGELRRSGRLLRLRSAGGRWTITYKGPADNTIVERTRHKSREEIETEVADGSAYALILAGLGYQPSFAYEKFRTTFKRPAVGASRETGIITLDETPIGDFLELEGPGPWIDQTAGELGFGPTDYVTSSYAALYEEYRCAQGTTRDAVPLDMRFHVP
jgi:adenylate cyclase class 2